MKNILLMQTHWSDDYWYHSKVTFYEKVRFVSFLDNLVRQLPAPGIGLYMDGFRRGTPVTCRHLAPAFLKILAIHKHQHGFPLIRFEFISEFKGMTSGQLSAALDTPDLLASISPKEWLRVQESAGIKPPKAWSDLLETKSEMPSWTQFIGQYYLALLKSDPEDRFAGDKVDYLLRAIGFEVVKPEPPEAAAGAIARFAGAPPGAESRYWFAYTTSGDDFALTATAARQMEAAVRRLAAELPSRASLPGRAVKFMFIAPDFDRGAVTANRLKKIEAATKAKGALVTFDALLYSLAERLRRGHLFSFAAFEKLFRVQGVVDARAAERLMASKESHPAASPKTTPSVRH